MQEIFKGEELKQEAYEKAGIDVGKSMLELLKSGPSDKAAKKKIEDTQVRDLPAVKAEVYEKSLAGNIEEEIKKLNQKYHFSLDRQVVYEKSLEHLLRQRADREITAEDYPDFSLIEDMYLNLFGEELIKEYKATGEDFTMLLNEKAGILREKNLIPNQKISDRISGWYEKAYQADQVV